MTLQICFLLASLAIAGTRGQTGKFDPLFNIPTPGSTKGTTTPSSETPLEVCVDNSGQKGFCVEANRCHTSDGAGVIQPRTGAVCFKSGHECCITPLDHPLAAKFYYTQGTQTGCGWRNELGIDQVPAEKGFARRGEFPWTVAIFKYNFVLSDKRVAADFIATGSLIHQKVVLTTAHNVADLGDSKLIVFVGGHNKRNASESQKINVISILPHELFNKANHVNNVALLFLKKPAVMSPSVGFACLASPTQEAQPGAQCLVSGWRTTGMEPIKSKLEAPIIDRSTCGARLRETALGQRFLLDESFLCAGGVQGVNTCVASGGSPLVCPIPTQRGRYIQHGITSWGMSCGQDGVPTVYVDVARMRWWIDAKMTGMQYGAATYTAN